MPIVVLLVRTRWGGRVVSEGDRVDVPPHVVARWYNRGIARLPEGSEVDPATLGPPPKPRAPRRKAPSISKYAPAHPTPLPDGFPMRELLRAYGYGSLEIIRTLTHGELTALKGIGPSKAKAIREAAGAA